MAFEILYETVTGQISDNFAVLGAENVFADGKPCDILYAQVQEACTRICQELGMEESADLVFIVDSMDKISKAVAQEVFRFCMEGAFTGDR